VSVERGDYCWRVDTLRTIPARLRWVCAEPLLGPLPGLSLEGIGLVVAGGESGPAARHMDPRWAIDLRDRCRAAGVPFYFKQSSGPRQGWRPLLEGERWQEMPEVPAGRFPLFG
jgi:protein gp37